jgi:hypothetical protein
VIRADQGGWTPIPPFYRTDGDVSLFFFAANSVQYTNQTLDPFYLALYGNANIDPTFILYYAYYPVSVMGCVDQYMIRNPNNEATTPLTGIVNLTAAISTLALGPAQNVTTQRLLKYFSLTSTYYSVLASGPNALKQADLVSNFRSSPPPNDQWRREVEGWFETTLASLQAYAVEYAANLADLGPHGSVTLPTGDDPSVAVWRSQCQNQKISNSGTYQTFSVFGLFFIFSFGIIIFLIDVFLERILSSFRRRGNWPPTEIANIADDKFQLQRMVFEGTGIKDWYNRDHGHPWLSGTCSIPQPKLRSVLLPNGKQGQSVDYLQPTVHIVVNSRTQAPSATAARLSTPTSHTQSSNPSVSSAAIPSTPHVQAQSTAASPSSPTQPMGAATIGSPASSMVNISSPMPASSTPTNVIPPTTP